MNRRLFATGAATLISAAALTILLYAMSGAQISNFDAVGLKPDGYAKPQISSARAAPQDAPTVTQVDPASAPNDLDTPIVITGTGFTAGMTVTLGNTQLPDAGWVSSTTLTATVPWGLNPGVYTLTVSNPDGQSGGLPKAFTVTQGIGVWTTGGPYGGVVDQIIINPITPTTLYAAAKSIGLFRSQDSGNSWKMVLADVGWGRYLVAMDSISPEIVYAARSSKGIARSDDGGDTWTDIPIPDQRSSVGNVFAHRITSGTVYVACRDGLWKSEDRGQHWADWTHGLTDTAVAAMAFHPTDPLIMYVGTELGNVFRSANGGLSWEFMGQPDLTISYLAVNPFGVHELWAVISMYQGGLWKYDSGMWMDILAGTGITRGVTIAFDQNISGTIWIGAQARVYTSTDGGQTWSRVGTLTNERTGALAIHPLDSQMVYAGYGRNGVYKTTNAGATWQPVNQGLAAAVPGALAPVPGEPNTLYAATGIGVMKTTQGGNAWIQLPDPSDWWIGVIAVDPFTRTRVYFGFEIGENGGTLWHPVSLTVPPRYETCCSFIMKAMFAAPAQPGRLVMGGVFRDTRVPYVLWVAGGIYTSTDYGETWTYADMHREISPVISLAYDPANPQVVYAGTTGQKTAGSENYASILKSSDDGNTWQESRAGLELACDIASIAVEPVFPRRVLASSTCKKRMWVSTDHGATWSTVNSPLLSGGSVDILVFAPTEPPVLYAGTTSGLYRTWDGAQTWEQLAGILGSAAIHALAIVTATDRTIVYAATAGGVVSTTSVQMRSLATSGETLLDPGVYRYTTRLGNLQAGSISGPTTGLIQRAYTFTATVSPPDAALPITYEWQATGQPRVLHANGLSDTVIFTWTTPGVKVVTVLADNDVGASVGDVHTIMVEQYHLYLPIILRHG